MHSQTLATEILRNYPIKVLFAGFESTTTALARAGWDLSLEETSSYEGNTIRLAMRHGTREDAIYGITQAHTIGGHAKHQVLSELFSRYSMHDGQSRWIELMRSIIFEVVHISPSFKFRIMPQMGGLNFRAFDSSPAYEAINVQEINMRDFKFFKTSEAPKELIIDPLQVPELLDMILKIQNDHNQSIKVRERSRENQRRMESGEFSGKSLHKVEAQIITLAV